MRLLMGVAEGKNLDEWIPEFARPADALFLISQAQLILHEPLIQCSVVSSNLVPRYHSMLLR